MGYKGLENGNRQIVSHAVRQSGIVFVFKSPLTTNDRNFGNHLILHGDAVKDVAFTVDDARGIYAKAIQRGARSIREPWEETVFFC